MRIQLFHSGCRFEGSNGPMSHEWLTGSNDVPIEYHNRPPFFVNHMLDATRKSLK